MNPILPLLSLVAPAYSVDSVHKLVLEKESAPAASRDVTYLHGFRSPSIGIEFRRGRIGYHAGLYTTIFGDDDSKSTEFLKIGNTFYFGKADDKFEFFAGTAFVRGLNRRYEDRNGNFFEVGGRAALGRGFELRLGVGLLVAPSRKPEFNPTIGLSYRL